MKDADYYVEVMNLTCIGYYETLNALMYDYDDPINDPDGYKDFKKNFYEHMDYYLNKSYIIDDLIYVRNKMENWNEPFYKGTDLKSELTYYIRSKRLDMVI